MKTHLKMLFHLSIILFFIFLFFLIYNPVIRGHYFYGEDYGLLWTSKQPLSMTNSYISFLRIMPFEGRPLESLYLYTAFNKYINCLKSVNAANTVRFIGIIGLGFMAYVLYLIFRENKINTAHAFILSLLICTLPPFQVFVSRVNLIVFIYSSLLSALSSLILFRVVFKEDTRKTYHMVIAVLLAFLLMVTSLNVYQSSAMVYWAMAVVPLIMLKGKDLFKKWRLPFSIYFLTGFASMYIYYKTTKLFMRFMDSSFLITFTKRGKFVGKKQIFQKIYDFIDYQLYTASNLWNIFPSRMVSLFVSIVILAGFLYGFRRIKLQKAAEEKMLDILCRYLLILMVIPLSFTPNLVIGENFSEMIPKHRILIGPTIVVLLLFYWGLLIIVTDILKYLLNLSEDLKNKIITISLVMLTIVAAFIANHNVDKYFVKLHTYELSHIKNTIQKYGVSKLSKGSKIYLIKSDREKLNYFSEFVSLSSGTESASIFMANLVLYELGIHADIPVVVYKKYDNPLLMNDSVVINMADFQEKAFKKLDLPQTIQPLF